MIHTFQRPITVSKVVAQVIKEIIVIFWAKTKGYSTKCTTILIVNFQRVENNDDKSQ